MSRERARRRVAREEERARLAAERERRRVVEQRRRRRREWLAGLVPRRRSRPRSVLAQRRRARRGVVILLFAAVQLLTWLLTPDWWHRVAVLAVSILALPVLLTLAFDRRS